MLLPLAAIVAGILLLLWSSDCFVDGAAALAKRLGVSQMLIGMIIVGFGTSLPEMTVSALSSWQGAPDIALGNAYGSNIANITLILGTAALIAPMAVRKTAVRQELPLLLAVTALATLHLHWTGSLTRLDGILLLIAFAAAMYILMRNDTAQDETEDAENEHAGTEATRGKALFQIIIGLAVLVASSRALVWGAVETARALGVGELVIGLTIVAVGTSLPELASSVAAARKNRHDIALGNVIGSNIFNTLVVVGIAACVHPVTVSPDLLRRDVPAMCFVTAVLFLACLGRKGKPGVISRAKGGALLALFVLYTVWVVFSV